MIHIPGFTFPVEEFLLEDVIQMIRWAEVQQQMAAFKRDFSTNINRRGCVLLGIVRRRRTKGPGGKRAFGRGEISGLRRRRKRRNTWKAGLVMHAPSKTGNGSLKTQRRFRFNIAIFLL